MTPLEVFLAYAKSRGIIPSMTKLATDGSTRTFYAFDQPTGQYKKKLASFKNVFDNHFDNHGFGNTMFASLLYQHPDGDVILRKPNVQKAHKRWTTFVGNNIISDGNVKRGSKVKYRWWGQEFTGVVEYINRDLSFVKVRRCHNGNIPFIDCVPPGGIIESDGEPANFSFHIKWKGKEYGNK